MMILAKYPGKCLKCGMIIKTGDKINWEKGVGAAHVKCGRLTVPGREGCGNAETCLGYHFGEKNCCAGCQDVGKSYNELHAVPTEDE